VFCYHSNAVDLSVSYIKYFLFSPTQFSHFPRRAKNEYVDHALISVFFCLNSNLILNELHFPAVFDTLLRLGHAGEGAHWQELPQKLKVPTFFSTAILIPDHYTNCTMKWAWRWKKELFV